MWSVTDQIEKESTRFRCCSTMDVVRPDESEPLELMEIR